MKTVSHMLDVLWQHGIGLSDGATTEDLISELTDEELEHGGFELLLEALGGESLEPAHVIFENNAFGMPSPRQRYSFRCLSDDVWHLDYECISSLDDYCGIVDRLSHLARGHLPLAEPGHELNFETGQAFVDLGITNSPLLLKMDFDWLDPAVIYACNNRLIELGSPKRFAAHPSGQSSIIICQTSERIVELNNATGMRFVQRYD